MSNTIYYHKHHIIPKHEWKRRFGTLNGVNNKNNIDCVTIQEHASIHYERWVYCGDWQDYVAWQGLSGQISTQEATLLAGKLGQINHIVSEQGRQSNIDKHSKNWLVTNPNGESFIIFNLFQFCRENNLQRQLMVWVAQGHRKHHKGWKVSYLT